MCVCACVRVWVGVGWAFQLPRVIIYGVNTMSCVWQMEFRGGAAVNDSSEPEFLPGGQICNSSGGTTESKT